MRASLLHRLPQLLTLRPEVWPSVASGHLSEQVEGHSVCYSTHTLVSRPRRDQRDADLIQDLVG